MRKTKYSIVIPVYKSSTSLIELAERTEKLFLKLPQAEYELIFVNDSPFSKKTVETLEMLTQRYPEITVIELMKNFGQQAATLCGIKYAKGDFIVTMDDDLQHWPEDICKLMEEQEHDVVIARFRDKKHSLFKRFTSEVKGYFDQIILGKPRFLKLSPFRLIKAEIAKLMEQRKTPFPFIPALLFEITDDLINIEVDHYPRMEGKSNYTFTKMIQVFSNLLISNSSFLLRMMGYIGIIVAVLACVAAAIIIIKKIIYGVAVSGWSSLIVLILIFGGMTLFTLGVIGEYLIRIIATTEERPVYHVRNIYGNREI